MLEIYYFEKRNVHTYDNVREFCLCEGINEEYHRSLLKKFSVTVFIVKILKGHIAFIMKNNLPP